MKQVKRLLVKLPSSRDGSAFCWQMEGVEGEVEHLKQGGTGTGLNFPCITPVPETWPTKAFTLPPPLPASQSRS